MKFTLKCLGYVCLLMAALWCLDRAVVGQAINWPRFHRYALTRFDDTTTLDVVKDAKTGICRLVYRVRETHRGPRTATSAYHEDWPVISATYLGEVPCDPIPVPPKVGDAPPASAIK